MQYSSGLSIYCFFCCLEFCGVNSKNVYGCFVQTYNMEHGLCTLDFQNSHSRLIYVLNLTIILTGTGNPWNDVACELWDAGDVSLAARFFQRAKACSRYENGAGHFPYLNLAKLRLSGSSIILDRDGLILDKTMHDTPSKEALLELCAALIRAPGGMSCYEILLLAIFINLIPCGV